MFTNIHLIRITSDHKLFDAKSDEKSTYLYREGLVITPETWWTITPESMGTITPITP